MNANILSNGWYAIVPQGSSWEAVRVIDGEIVDRIAESDAGRKIREEVAAYLADDPHYRDLPIEQGIALSLLWDADVDPEMVATTRLDYPRMSSAAAM